MLLLGRTRDPVPRGSRTPSQSGREGIGAAVSPSRDGGRNYSGIGAADQEMGAGAGRASDRDADAGRRAAELRLTAPGDKKGFGKKSGKRREKCVSDSTTFRSRCGGRDQHHVCAGCRR